MKLSMILENGTDSSIEVRTKSATGVLTLMASIKPGEKHEFHSDTYWQEYGVFIRNSIQRSVVLIFNSHEVEDNERIKIVQVGDSYSKEVTPRLHGVPKPTTASEKGEIEPFPFEKLSGERPRGGEVFFPRPGTPTNLQAVVPRLVVLLLNIAALWLSSLSTVVATVLTVMLVFLHLKMLRIPGLIWKYHFWRLVGTMLKFNKAFALKLADFLRRMDPHLAPCNALQDDVTCTAKTSTFIAKTTYAYRSFVASRRVVDIDDRYKSMGTDFSNQYFKIGAGSVTVTKLPEDQYRFTCEVRGRFLENFVAITDLESMARILSILRLWEASPKVGVIEDLALWGDSIYCHALNIKEIVEGVHKSPGYFSIFCLSRRRRFFVGCGRRGTTTSKVMLGLTYVLSVMGTVACYYQLKTDFPKVATGIVVILGVLSSFIINIDLLGPLFTQSCFYWLCTILCCGNANRRLGVYIWLKKIGSHMPYCDDFEPDQLLLEDGKVEVNHLFKSVHKSRLEFGVPFGVKRSPDWTMFPTINIDNLDVHSYRGAPWTNITPNNNDNNNVKFKLFKDVGDHDDNYDAVIFMVEFTYTNYFIQSSRVIYVRSEYDRTQPRGQMTTCVESFNGRGTHYIWSVSSFHLFVYLLLLWGKTKHGVIEYYENFMLRTYNHVFSVHDLAEHIEKHELETYYVLLADQTPQPVPTIPQPVLPAQADVNGTTSCCNELLRPCTQAFGHQSLGSVSVSV